MFFNSEAWWDFRTEFIVRNRKWRHQFQLEKGIEEDSWKNCMKEKICQLGEFYWLVFRSLISQRLVLLTRKKKRNIMLPAVCLLSAVWRQTPITQARLYQRPDRWRRFLVLLVIDVLKPPGTYFNNWLQLSCRSSKLSSSFPTTSVLSYDSRASKVF